jgi:hypothetical protein
MEKWVTKSQFCKDNDVTIKELNDILKGMGLMQRKVISEGVRYYKGKKYPVINESNVLTTTSYRGVVFAKKRQSSGSFNKGTFLFRETFLKDIIVNR